jgi:hypothetical protein
MDYLGVKALGIFDKLWRGHLMFGLRKRLRRAMRDHVPGPGLF